MKGTNQRFGSATERFWRKVEIRNDVFYCDQPCWEWKGALKEGYGIISRDKKDKRKPRQIGAHRWSYEYFIGEIPFPLVPDHLCRNRWCVNPLHMEAVSRKENSLRGEGPCACHAKQTKCLRGHSLTDGDVRISKTGHRECRICQRLHAAKYRRSLGMKKKVLKLNEALVLEMRELYKTMTIPEIRKIHPHLSEPSIWQAVSGYSWSHLPGAIRKSKIKWRKGIKTWQQTEP